MTPVNPMPQVGARVDSSALDFWSIDFWSIDFWSKIAMVILISPMLIGKAAVYLNLLLGGVLLLSAPVLWDRWLVVLTRRGHPFSPMAWALLTSVLYGLVQVIRGTLAGYPVMTALQILIFNVCPIYIFLGLWVGERHPAGIRTYIRFQAWWMVIYAPLYFIVFKNFKFTLSGFLPGNSLDLLADPGTGSVVLIGLVTLESSLVQFWLPILVLACLTIAYQGRSDWLGLGMVMMVWAKLTHMFSRLMAVAACGFAVLLLATLIDLKLPPLPGRGNELSARGTVARIAGSVSPELATEFGADAATARFDYGTVYWREHWWTNISNEVTKNYKSELFGLGYGYPLAHLADRDVEKQGTRSPHSIFYFTVAYSGIVGFALFCWFCVCVLHLLWQVYKTTGETFGLIYFLYILIAAFFGNLIETPQAAIPLYLLCGMALGPLLRAEMAYDDESSAFAQVEEVSC